MMLKEVKFLLNQDQLNHTLNLNQKFMYLQKMNEEDILHSLNDINHNSISELLMLLDLLNYQKV